MDPVGLAFAVAVLKNRVAELESENARLRKAIESFGNNPAGFDWAVLTRLDELERENERLRKIVDTQRRGLTAVDDLIRESRGVCGLHLNGDEAPWDELRTGGRFEEWLRCFDQAAEAAKENA